MKEVGLDGGTAVTLASGQNDPQDVAVDSTNVYWTNAGGEPGLGVNGTVMKALKVPVDGGTAMTLASGQNYPYGIAVDTTNVYWADQGPLATAVAPGRS